MAADRTGQPQAFRIDLKTGEARQLTEVANWISRRWRFPPTAGHFCCLPGDLCSTSAWPLCGSVKSTGFDGWERCPGMSLTPDGAHALFAERRGEGSRLRAVSLAQGISSTAIEARFAIEHPLARPGRDQILYRQTGRRSGWWMQAAPTTAGSSGAGPHRLRPVEPGRQEHPILEPAG